MIMIKKQRGTAVFTALFVVVIATAITVTLLIRQSTDIRRTTLIITEEQVNQYAAGALYWAQVTLDGINSEDNHEGWPKKLPPTLIAQQQGVVAAELNNLSEVFNINDVDAKSQEFIDLLQNLPQPVNQSKAQELKDHLTAWIKQQYSDEVDSKYLSKKPPYRAAFQPMVSVSELRLVSGFTPKIIEQLLPQIIAYPKGASGSKENGPFYLLKTDIKFQQQTLTLYTLLHHKSQGGKVEIRVLWQSRGTL